MELLDFITKLASNNAKNEREKYWRVVVNCFLVDGFEQIQLGTLPSYFKQYYGQVPTYDGKLSSLLLEPEFKAVCLVKKINTTIWVAPSSFLLRVISAQLTTTDQKEFKTISNLNSMNNGNNTNILKVSSQNPFAILAQKEIEGSDKNDEARFGRVTLEELNCGICFELLREAVEGNCCRNLFCLPCIELNGRKCPNCRKLVEWAANEPIRRLIAKKPVQCEYEECKAWSTVGEIEQHRIKCEFNPENLFVGCQKCHQRIMRRLLEEHLGNTCEMNEIPCGSCGAMIVRKELADHEAGVCEYRRVSCSYGCGEHMTHKEYVTVHVYSCSHQPVACTNQQCSMRVQRRLLSAHLDTCKHTRVPCIHRVRGCDVVHIRASMTTLKSHEQVCRYMLVQCPYGCDEEMLKHKVKSHKCDYMLEECNLCRGLFRKRDLKAHGENCPSRQIECPNQCGEEITAKYLERHLPSCPKRIVSCRLCKTTITADCFEVHATNCPRRRVKCPNCKGTSTARNFHRHVSSRCPKRQVECESCQELVVVASLSHHEEYECPERLLTCKLCEEDVTASSLSLHQRTVCKNRSVVCPACRGAIVARDLPYHQSVLCPYRRVSCPDCREATAARDLPYHLSALCPNRRVSCPDCRSATVAKDLEYHRSALCPNRRIWCPDCQESVAAPSMQYHKAIMCPEGYDVCQKCNESMSRRQLDLHILSCGKSSCIIS